MKDFPRFWKQNAVSLIVGLVITLALCVVMGVKKLWFSLPAWVVIAVIFWLLRTVKLYLDWKREQPDEE